jgi:hypothetical protein
LKSILGSGDILLAAGCDLTMILCLWRVSLSVGGNLTLIRGWKRTSTYSRASRVFISASLKLYDVWEHEFDGLLSLSMIAIFLVLKILRIVVKEDMLRDDKELFSHLE